MGRKFLWLFLCCVMAVTLVAWSCGGTQNGEQEEEEEEDGLAWSDFPKYPGADQQYEPFSIFPSTGTALYTWEWRYYTTSASNDKVRDYYKDKMPEYGWDQSGFNRMPSYIQITYTKDLREEMAFVLIAPDNDDTIIALGKGTAK